MASLIFWNRPFFLSFSHQEVVVPAQKGGHNWNTSSTTPWRRGGRVPISTSLSTSVLV
jgi:hypothetical protein